MARMPCCTNRLCLTEGQTAERRHTVAVCASSPGLPVARTARSSGLPAEVSESAGRPGGRRVRTRLGVREAPTAGLRLQEAALLLA